MAGERYFNGTTLVFNSTTVGKIISISRAGRCKDIEITSLDEADHISAAGKPKRNMTVRTRGTSALTEGTIGALTVTWKDSTTIGTFDYAVLLANECSGELDGAIETTLEFAHSLSS